MKPADARNKLATLTQRIGDKPRKLVAPRPVDMAPLDEARERMERIRQQIIADRILREARERQEALNMGRHRGPPLVNPHEP